MRIASASPIWSRYSWTSGTQHDEWEAVDEQPQPALVTLPHRFARERDDIASIRTFCFADSPDDYRRGPNVESEGLGPFDKR